MFAFRTELLFHIWRWTDSPLLIMISVMKWVFFKSSSIHQWSHNLQVEIWQIGIWRSIWFLPLLFKTLPGKILLSSQSNNSPLFVVCRPLVHVWREVSRWLPQNLLFSWSSSTVASIVSPESFVTLRISGIMNLKLNTIGFLGRPRLNAFRVM